MLRIQEVIASPAQLADFAERHGLTDWHEPDEQDITAVVRGSEFDNAMGVGEQYGEPYDPRQELTVYFVQQDEHGHGLTTLAAVNLANLCEWAAQAGRTSTEGRAS